MKTILKLSFYLILGFIGLLILLLVFSQTSWFREILKDQIVSIANEQIKGTLSIEEINGNFFSNLEISGIRIEKNDTTLVYTEKVSLDYDLSGILLNSININFIKIDSIYAFLKQENDTTWNLARLMKETEEPDTNESEFDWNIKLSFFEIDRTEVSIAALDTTSFYPAKLDNINFSASAELTPQIKRFAVNTFSLKSYLPDFEIKDLDIKAELSDEIIEIEKFVFETAMNKIDLNAKYFLSDSTISTISVITDPINFEEFKPFLPSISIKEEPILSIEGNYQNYNADIDLTLVNEDESIYFSIIAGNLNLNPNYNIDIKIASLQLDKWTADPGFSSDLNGEMRIKGSGTSLQTFDTYAEVIIAKSRINRFHLDTLIISAEVRQDNATLKVSLDSEFAKLLGDINLEGFEDEKKYKVKLNADKLNVSPLLADSGLNSDINFLFMIDGQGFDPDNLIANLSFVMTESNFMVYSIGSINSKIKASNGVFRIDSLSLISDYADLKISGNVSPSKKNNIKFKLLTKDISVIPQLSELGDISLSGEIKGSAEGYADALSINIDIILNDIVYDEYRVNDLLGKIDISKKDDSYTVSVNSEVSDLDLNGTSINGLSLDASYDGSNIRSTFSAEINDTSNVNILSEVAIDSIITIIVEDLNFEISDYTWSNLKDRLLVVIDKDKYSFKDIALSNGEQSIVIEGYLDQNGTSDMTLKIDKLDIGDLVNTFKKEMNLEAVLDTEIKFKGEFKKPEVKGSLVISGIKYNELSGEMITNFSLVDEKLEYMLSSKVNQNSLVSEGNLAMKLNSDDSTSFIPEDEPVNAILNIDIPSLAPFAKFIEPVDKLEGSVQSQLAISNTLNNLDVNGFFRIENSLINSELYGIDFNDIDINFEAENKNYYLRKFYIGKDEGKLSIEGLAEFDKSPLTGSPSRLKLDLEADEFEIANSRNLEAKIDGNLSIQDVGGDAKFSGDLSLLRSRIFVPYFIESASGQMSDESKPLLIKELEKKRAITDTLKIAEIITDEDSLKINKFMENISGRFRLKVPKNTWLVSPDMNIELSGEVDIVKEGDYLELYGNIETVRGRLRVYGKEFSILEGQILFSGGSELNPQLNIRLEYLFRGADKSKRILELFITGKAKEPSLSFKIDNTLIDEGNAISYLLFARSLDELSQGQKSNVKTNDNTILKIIAGNLIESQLRNTVGEALGLDVIDIKGGNNWKQASFVAGKYLTEDLFVSYERGFGNSETNEVNPRKVTLEYALSEIIFFQLVEGNDKTAGFDFIFKFEF